jgi:uncharacterized protein YqgC (DUF456 family)
MTIFAVLLMVLALFLIPLGLPGLWIMIGVIALGAIYKTVGLFVLLGALALAVVAELLEFIFVKRLTNKYGGSRKAFWGAMIGGLIGVVVGVPIPVIGSVIAGFIGSFLGAVAATLLEGRDVNTARRVGWGVLLGRALAAGAKTAAGVVILVMGVTAFLG